MSLSRNIASLTITQQDDAGADLIARTVGPLTYDANAGEFQTGQLISTGVTSITLPTSGPVIQFYLRNRHASAKLSVSWTPSLGSSAIAQILGPNGIIAFWSTNQGSSYGITALWLQSDSTSTPVEYFLGG